MCKSSIAQYLIIKLVGIKGERMLKNKNILFNVLFKPVDYFDKFKQKRSTFLNIITLLVLNSIIIYMFSGTIFDSVLTDKVDTSLPIETYEKFKPIFSILILFMNNIQLIFTLLLSSIILVVLAKVFKIKVKMADGFAILVVAYLPIMFSNAINYYALSKFGIESPITSMGILLEKTGFPILMHFGSQVEIFNIWSCFLIGLGVLTCADSNSKNVRNLIIAYWILQTALNVVFKSM